MKIKFFLNSLVRPRGTTSEISQSSSVLAKTSTKPLPLYVNPSYWYLRHFYNLHGKNKKVDWLMPEFFKIYNLDSSIKIIADENPDVLCFSMFVWNYDFNIQLAKQAKAVWPNIKIIMGGPELTAHNKPGFFKIHPYVDFVVYGDGEKAFTQLLDYFLNPVSSKESWVNIVENCNETDLVYPYEMLTDDLFFSTSPYIEQEEFIVESLKYNRNNLKKYYRNDDCNFMIGMEFSRGCMYSCTFCDWGQNLTKKVKRGKRDFFNDVDFFYKNDLIFNETDANFGQWDDDLKIFDYAISRYNPSKNFKFVVTNTPKLKKSATEHIIKTQLEHYNGDFLPSIAFQDADELVLKNINRPAYSINEQFELINKIKQSVSKENFSNLAIQLIIGLPGQQLSVNVKNVIEIIANTGVSKFTTGLWELLANSPANDRFYQSMHKLKFDQVFTVQKTVKNCDLNLIYKNAVLAGKTDPLYTCSKSMIIESGNLTWWDILTLSHFYGMVNNTPYKIFENKSQAQIEKIINGLFNITVKKIHEQKLLHEPLIEYYGVRLLNFYDADNRIILQG